MQTNKLNAAAARSQCYNFYPKTYFLAVHYGKTVRVTYPAFGYCLLRTERILSFNLQFPKRIAYQHQPGLIQSWKVLKTFQAGETKLVVKHLKMIT